MRRWTVFCLLGLLATLAVSAQNYAPPEPIKATEEQLQAIKTKASKLEFALASLKRRGVRDPYLADIEIYHKAATWIVRHGEFYKKDYIDATLDTLDRGLLRATQQGMGETPWVNITGASVIRAYRSRIDHSVQPYAVTLPSDYGKDTSRRWRLDIVLHGRNATLTEATFIKTHSGDKPTKDRPFVQIDIYGRGNNAYRWAGESDVYEAMNNFLAVERLLGREQLIDPAKVVLRGFSMGGAGTWHLGLHRPDRWAVLGPGAGFTVTKGYTPLPDQLPPYIDSCLKIYDAVEYAENAFDVPVVAYSGDKDKQMQAAVNIENKLKGTNISITHLVAPGLEHQFPPEWQAKAEKEYAKYADKGRPESPKKVRFVTYTLKYNNCDWVEILGLDRHYDKTLVDAERTEAGYKIDTTNVRQLHLTLPAGDPRTKLAVEIDRQSIEATPSLTSLGEGHLYLEKREGTWKAVLPQKILVDQLRRLQKAPGMQGPIDDAFTNSFLCVRGTGTPWNKEVHDHAEANLKRFAREWDRFFRGEIAIKDDVNVTPEDIATKNLILFGDPGSNRLIAQVLDGLPIRWTQKTVSIGDLNGDASKHVPALIYPSPLNVEHYVVINSGHTFHEKEFLGTNALLYPRLGDYALLKLTPTDKDALAVEVTGAGLFDEFWRVKSK